MSTATLALSWAVGGACVLLGALIIEGWLRNRDGTRAFLALSIVLLCACGLAVAATVLTDERYTWTSDVTLALFLGSGWAFFAFRAAMDHPRVVTRLVVMDGLPVVEHLERLRVPAGAGEQSGVHAR